jgi:PAS domain S-box-containing protein
MRNSNDDLLKTLIEASDVMLVVLSTDLEIQEWNKAAERVLDYKKEEVIGKKFLRTFIHSTEEALAEKVLTDILEGKETHDYEYVLKSKSGKEKTILWNAQRIVNEDGSLKGVLTIGKDLSERIEKEISLRTSESKLRALIAGAIDGIITINQEGIMDSVNPATTKLFGYEKEELIGKNVSMLMPEPFRSHHDGYLLNYIKTSVKKIIGIGREVPGMRKDGTLFPFRLSVTEIFVSDHRTFMGMVHDLTSQKAAEQKIKEYTEKLETKVQERTYKLEESNENLQHEIKERMAIEDALKKGQKLYSAMARNFPDGTISVLDKDLRYVFIEGKELFAMGVTSDRLLGTKLADRLPANLSKQITEVLQNVFRDRKETIEVEINNNHYVLNAVPLPDDHGQVNQILVVEENITKQKKAEQSMRQALTKEKELSQLKSRFVSLASHEFRTPLATILSSASLLEKYNPFPEEEEKRSKHLKRIKSAVSNLTSILNDFLSLSKLEEGHLGCNPSAFKLSLIIRELKEEMQEVAKSKQELNYVHKGQDDSVFLDKLMLKNVLNNLVSNAIKYSPEGASINVHSSIKNNILQIEVQDNGMGIPESEQSFLFERFFRAKNVTHIQGTGLGLNIVQKYLDLMNGKIDFKSREGKGTTFIIEFTNALPQ